MTNKNYKENHSLLLFKSGIVLFLASLINGFLIHLLPLERLAISSHLLGLIGSAFLITLGSIWSRLKLSEKLSKISMVFAIYGFCAGWAIYFFAAATGTGGMFPILSGGIRGSSSVEGLISIGMLTMAISLFAFSLIIIFIGLRNITDNHKISKEMENTIKGYKGKSMEGFIARWYSKTRGKYIKEFEKRADKIVSHLKEGAKVLEVASGPGYLAIEIKKRGNFSVTGLDISETFVDIATEKAKMSDVDIDFHLGNASELPFVDSQFDFIVCESAFKNFSQPIEVLNEMYRVLAPNGMALIFDLNKNADKKKLEGYIRQMNLSSIDRFVTNLTFKYMLLPRSYSRIEFEELVRKSKFKEYEIDDTSLELIIKLKKDKE